MRLFRATPDETHEIEELDRREFSGADWPGEDPATIAWWTIDHDPELGYCGARIGGDPLERWRAPFTVLHLTRGWVSPELHGQGWQARMIRRRLAWGRERGCARAQTYTWHDNIASMRNLARAGFVPLRARQGYIRWERTI